MHFNFRNSVLAGTAVALALVGCSNDQPKPVDDITTLPKKLQDQVGQSNISPLINGATGERRNTTQVVPGPAVPPAEPPSAALGAKGPTLTGQVETVSVEQMPLPTFINTIFGETLHLTFEIDPKVTARTDLVTLRTGGPKSAQELLAVAEQVLKNYGIQVTFDKGIARVRPSESLQSDMPRIIIGRTGPDVAPDLRPIFQVVPLENVNNQDMAGWISTAFGAKIKFSAVPVTNSIILMGLQDDVKAANDAIRLLDQPRLAGRRSLRIVPVFWSVTALAEKLGDVLRAEGYNVSATPNPPAAITLLPISGINAILVFGSDQKTLDHVAKWVHDLDTPAQVDPRQSVFYYPVRNTTAESLAKVLNDVIGSAPAGAGGQNTAELEQPSLVARQLGQQAASAASKTSARFITDTARNALIFLGSADAYAQIRPLVESLDQAPREVLIEVTIATITLSDSQNLGVEWSKLIPAGQGHTSGNTIGVAGGAATPASPFAPSTSSSGILGSTTTATGAFGGGLILQVLNDKNAVGESLSALATTSKTKVIATPRLLARSGATAKFQIGTDVPIVTSQVTSSTLAAGSGLQQSITYRSTGTILSVKPIIYSGNLIDLDISQEQSQALPGTSSASGESPSISDQNVTTSLSLADGATVMLGGFINESKSEDNTGVPYLKDIPGLGMLFRSADASVERSETLIFITPYIINSGGDSDRIVESVRENMKQWPEVRGTTIY